VVLLFLAQSAFAFSLLGPVNEPYQQGGSPNSLDYNFYFDNGAPKNLGEEYRWNTPTIYYSFDQNFLDYFGSNGVYAVDQAFAIMNSLTNVDSYSADLSEFPLDSGRVNYKAQILLLRDIKSEVLHWIMEQMGLAEPDRYTWTLRDRVLPPGAACPRYDYLVIKRNFDPVTFEPSSYVNGALYSYTIFELCNLVPPLNRADAVEISVDPLSLPWTAVAADGSFVGFADGLNLLRETDEGVARYGFYYTGLTRDDVGGLRYLWRTNNVNVESVEPSSVQFITNNATLVFGSNLTVFADQSLTNPPAVFQALYPNLVINSSTQTF
jgi:hypothetical protein